MKKYILFVLVISFFVAIPFSNAQTNQSLCYGFATNLYKGSRGADVVVLQNVLINKGFLAAGLHTGTFGPATYAAVQSFQRSSNITPINGNVGPLTRAALNSACQASSITIVAAGDVAKTATGKNVQTGQLIQSLNPIKVLVLGDLAYEDGTLAEFNSKYDPSWGQFKNKTAPAPGNHEYNTSGARGYYDYFGTLAGPDRRGYYSFDLGNWHIVSLNSEVVNQAQINWLEQDLSSNTKACILAFWHKPVFSSGDHGNNSVTKPLWDKLQAKGADLVLVGHDHNYERFAKQNSNGQASATGIRQIVVGTGGASQNQFKTIRANSEMRATNQWGVLELKLKDTSYDAFFRPAAGSTFTDSITNQNCN